MYVCMYVCMCIGIHTLCLDVKRGHGDHSLSTTGPKEGMTYERLNGEKTFITGAVDLLKRTFRHSLGPGAVRCISPRERRKEVGEPSQTGCPGAPPSASRLMAMPGVTQLTKWGGAKGEQAATVSLSLFSLFFFFLFLLARHPQNAGAPRVPRFPVEPRL